MLFARMPLALNRLAGTLIYPHLDNMNSALTPASPRPRLAARSESVPPPGLTRNDILFALFRHKKMIAILTLLGFVAAAAVYFFYPPTLSIASQVARPIRP